MVEVIKNFTVDDLDSAGRPLIGDNHVTHVFYYDTRDETWPRDFSSPPDNPISNPYFLDTTVTGTGPFDVPGPGWYETGSDALKPPSTSFFKIGKLPYFYQEELIAEYGTRLESSTTQDGSVHNVSGDYFINADAFTTPPKNVFPSKYLKGWDTSDRWATTSGVPGGPTAYISYSFDGVPQEIAGFFIDSWNGIGVSDSDGPAASIRDYDIQIAISGTGLFADEAYFTVASGTFAFGDMRTRWVGIVPTTAKFVRILFNNHGLSWRTNLSKFWAFSQDTIDKGMSLAVTRMGNLSDITFGGRTLEINQDVNFGGVNRLYFDIADFGTRESNLTNVRINGVSVGDPFVNHNPIDSYEGYTARTGYSLDVSSFGSVTLQFRKQMHGDVGKDSAFIAIANFTVVPPWYSEQPGAERGDSSPFPNEVLFAIDKGGMSIIDVSGFPTVDEVDPVLWMRFSLGDRKMLELRPRKVAAREGKIYLATSHGLYIIDFLANCSTRLNERGTWKRYGIHFRNKNSFGSDVLITSSVSIPHRMLDDYGKVSASPVIPNNDIYDVVAGTDVTFGDFVILGTSAGLLVFDDKVDGTGIFYRSKDRRPVYNVRLSGDTIWYTQGSEATTTVGFLETVNSANQDDFVPDKKYHQDVSLSDSLSGVIDRSQWEILQQDPDMNLIEGAVLTISGSHTRGGATGLISKRFIPNRSFVAKVKVRLLQFPPDARGAVRFGFVYDYKDEGIRSLRSNAGFSARVGFFLSALNTDPYGGHLMEDAPFDTHYWDDQRGWFFAGAEDPTATVRHPNTIQPTSAGISFDGKDHYTLGGDENLLRVVSVWPFLKRDFTARLDVQISTGFGPINNNTYDNPGVWFGLANRSDFIPGTTAGGDYIDNAMVVTAKTSFSGVAVYTAGYADSSANLIATLAHDVVVPLDSAENTGPGSSPFREWAIHYDYATDEITALIDGTVITTQTGDENNQPPVVGMTFGLYNRSDAMDDPARQIYAKNFRITYPALNPASRFKYGLEKTSSGGIKNVLAPHITFSGIALNPDVFPVSGTLSSSPGLSDGVLHSSGVTMGQDVSIGTALSGTGTVEALYLYDTAPTTDGWASANAKRAQVWYSEDNVLWSFHREFDLNKIERTAGITKLNFVPALDGKFFKVRGLDVGSNYNVGGGGVWAVAEIQPLTLSGADFFASDASSSAEFHEWKMVYDAEAQQVDGYIDDVLVSTTSFDGLLEEGQFVLVHDLSPVNSGTSTIFNGEFKDFDVVFTDPSFVASGDITGFSVFENNIVGGGTNHTLLTATLSGAAVADFELGPGATLPDTIQRFDHEEDIFGSIDRPRTIFADATTYRGEGLVFIGTGSFTQTPTYTQRYNKPLWIERAHDPGNSASLIYGGRLTLGYHPGENKLFVIVGSHARYFSILDLNTGTWNQVQRESFLSTMGTVTYGFQRDAAKTVFSPYDNRMWVHYADSRLGAVDINDGDTKRALIGEGSISGDSGQYALAYVLHNHWVLYGQEYLDVWDVVSHTDKQHPRTWGSNGQRWNRFRSLIPWGGDSGGHSVAIYCDYDKCVYFAGADGYYGNQQEFYRWIPDKDWLELVTDGVPENLRWPYEDKDASGYTPVNVGSPKGSWLVYEPHLKRIYVVGALGVVAQFYYYDLVTREWVYPGETPPYNAWRDWPSAHPAEAGVSISHAVYNYADRTIVMYGRGNDPELYEYHPERDFLDVGFEYIPSRDGLPTNSGIAKHFTHGEQPIQSCYDNVNDWDRDFYRSPAYDDTRFDFTFGSGCVTISGVDQSLAAEEWDRELFVSTELMDASRSFDISAQVALPKFEKIAYDTSADGEIYFVMGIRDGLNSIWTDTSYGSEDLNLFQVVEIRAGVSGTQSQLVEGDFVGHIYYSDAQNNEIALPIVPHQTLTEFDSYKIGGLDLNAAFSDPKEFRLKYTYETDTLEGFIEGTSVGSTTLKRKFNPNGVRFHMGFWSNLDTYSSFDPVWIAEVSDLTISPMAWDRIEACRLITSISGSVGSYYHERWDSTITSGTSWVYESELYLPTNRRFSGFDYIASLAGIGDGHKVAELVAFVGPGQRKQIAFTSDVNQRHNRNTYLGAVNHAWDDIDIGKYRIVRDAELQTVEVFINDSKTAAISVPYESLADYKYQHIYYGKRDYGAFERFYGAVTLSGTWNTQPNFTGSSDPTVRKQRWFNDSTYAKFATVTQVSPLATATYNLDPDLGTVDVYTFYVASGYDLAKNTPYSITASGVVSLPSSGAIVSVETNTDYSENFDPLSTTVRVDQRLLSDGTGTSTDKNRFKGSGWVYLGTYLNPSQVVVTADAVAGTDSTQAFVCAGAVGVDVGKRGRSTFDMSVNSVRYQVGQTELTPVYQNPAGISVIDLATNERIDSYGEQTAPVLLDGNITSGGSFE